MARIPSNIKSSDCNLWFVVVLLGSIVLGAYIIYYQCFTNSGNIDWLWLLGGIILVFCSYFIARFARTFVLNSDLSASRCPNCGDSFCIDYLDSKTISENVITEYEEQGNRRVRKNYRVGVKRIHWQCDKCGYESEDEVKYKERV